MSTALNFSGNYYRNIANHKYTANYENSRTAADAFILCINSLPYEELDNLCNQIQQYYQSKEEPIFLSLKDCYQLTQGQDTKYVFCDKEFKQTLLSLAYKCIDEGKTVGSKLRENSKSSTTAWLSHCLYQGESAATLAKSLGLNPDTARKLGLLHDIGRKYTHTLMHTIAGFETLVDEGWIDEAYICLTHSFIGNKITKKGGRCCSCDPAIPGFYIDENGNPQLDTSFPKDDITAFLDFYNYNDYDSIINMADLMAASYGITSPYERVSDIATRTTPDPRNRNYFKAEFSNLMLYFLARTKQIEYPGELKAKPETTEADLEQIFYNVSTLFSDYYNTISPTKLVSKSKQTQK